MLRQPFTHQFPAVGLDEMALTSILAPIVISASRAKRCWCQLTDEVGHALRGRAGGAFGPDLAKKLSQLVKMEKNVMRSLELVARERMEVAVCGFLPYIAVLIILIKNSAGSRFF